MSKQHAPNWETNGYYAYEPNFPTAIVGAALFSITCLLTVFQYFWFRSWYFWPMVLAALMEMLGFVARAPNSADPTNRTLYIIQFCMIILAPAIMAAALYMTFGRIIFWTTPPSRRGMRHLWVPARFITPIFVCFDIVSFAIQLFGAVVVSAAEPTDFKKIKRGGDIVKIGLAVQLVCFGFFTIVGLRFALAAGKWVQEKPGWKRLNWTVNAGCALILVRSVYRMVEFAEGHGGYLRTTELWFWVLDALLMLLVFVFFNIVHPAMYLPNVGFKKDAIKSGDYEETVPLEQTHSSGKTNVDRYHRTRAAHA